MVLARFWRHRLQDYGGILAAPDGEGRWWWSTEDIIVLKDEQPPKRDVRYAREIMWSTHLARIHMERNRSHLIYLEEPAEVIRAAKGYGGELAVFRPQDGTEYGFSKLYFDYMRKRQRLRVAVIGGKPLGWPALAVTTAGDLAGLIMPALTPNQVVQLKARTIELQAWPPKSDQH